VTPWARPLPGQHDHPRPGGGRARNATVARDVSDDLREHQDAAADEGTQPVDRADRWQQKLAVPVLIAALASVPAVFMTLFEDPWDTIGGGLNTASGLVLVAETVVLFALAEDRRAWLWRNRWLVGLAVVIVPAVVFAVGPVQLLRVVRAAGALRLVRVGRIFRAGRIVRDRAGLDRTWQRVIGFGATALCAVFVALVLADPTSSSRQVVDGAMERPGWVAVVAAGLVLGAATYIVRTARADD
jgi:CsoR family transcriptional regulator, copper-sensing transcriptional repressor